jgi:hypothetical protein
MPDEIRLDRALNHKCSACRSSDIQSRQGACMSDLDNRAPSTRHYFVDEAGDGTLFDGKGRVIIGSEGCSRFFILGLVDIPDPESLRRAMAELRAALMADPYFAGIPSMQPNQRKTALAFHAKDDVAEVRREVFALLRRHAGIRFFAVVKDKRATLDYVLSRNEREPRYRYESNELYRSSGTSFV